MGLWKHPTLTSGTMSFGIRREAIIAADGTYTVPDDEDWITERLETLGHTRVDAQAPTQPDDETPVVDGPTMDLASMSRRDLYQLGKERGITFEWSGPNATSREDMLAALQAGA